MPDAKCPRCGGPALVLLFTSSRPCDCRPAKMPQFLSGEAGRLRHMGSRFNGPPGDDTLDELYVFDSITPFGTKMGSPNLLRYMGLPNPGTAHPLSGRFVRRSIRIDSDPIRVVVTYGKANP